MLTSEKDRGALLVTPGHFRKLHLGLTIYLVHPLLALITPRQSVFAVSHHRQALKAWRMKANLLRKLDSSSIPHWGYKTSTFLPEVPFLRTRITGYLSQECSGNQQMFALLFEVYKCCIWVKSSSCIHRKLFPRRKVWLWVWFFSSHSFKSLMLDSWELYSS